MSVNNHSVGRVGALAVALGIGSAVMGFAATAVADTGDQTDSTGQQASRPSGAASKARAGTRRSAQEKNATPAAAAADAEAEAGDDSGARAGVSSTRSAVPSLGVARKGGQVRTAMAPSVGVQSAVPESVAGGKVQSVAPAPTITTPTAPEAAAPQTVATEVAAPPQTEAAAVAEAPVMTEADTMSEAEVDPTTSLGDGTDAPLAEPIAWAAAAVARRLGEPEAVAPAAALATAAPPEAADVAAATFENPAVPSGSCKSTTICGSLISVRGTIQNQIAADIVKLLPSAGVPAGTCSGSTCTASPANYIASYAFNVIYSLMGGLPTATVATAVQQLASQPEILTFISQTVAAKFPEQVGPVVGNAVATFVQNSFGNINVATQFVPFLEALNLPTTGTLVTGPYAAFLAKITANSVTAAILSSGNGNNARSISTSGMQSALIQFFSNAGDQAEFGDALTDAINVLMGISGPTWDGAIPTPSNAVADYIGQTAALALLGVGNPSTEALTDTISTAVTSLFGAIGPVVSAQAGDALVTLLQQPNVADYLADDLTNATVTFLGGVAPYPLHDSLMHELAPAAGVAVAQFVNGMLTDPSVLPALGTFVGELIPGILGNVGVQEMIGQRVADEVSALLGGGDLGQLVGEQVGDAVAGLAADTAVSGALVALVNTVLGDFLTAPGVITALAGTAGQLATADLDGTISTAGPLIEQALRQNPVIYNAVDGAVTDAVGGLLTDSALWTVVDSTLESLMIGLLGDVQIQDALSARVAAEVSTALGGGQLGDLVGAQVGTMVVNLVTDPTITAELPKLVDTVFSDFFGYFGVDSVLSNAAGELAAAAVNGTWATVYPQVRDALKTNSTIDAAAGLAVGDAVMAFLGTAGIWTAVDTNVTDLVNTLLADTDVQNAFQARIASEVSDLLGGGDLGTLVGAQVGAAVVGFVTDPLFSNAVLGLVDSVFTDFFGYTGVIDAFGQAADILTVDLLVGESFQEASQDAGAYLKGNDDVDQAVGVAVGDAVALALGDLDLWAAADTAVTTLVNELLADVPVQNALSARVSSEVSALLGGGQLGAVVGPQVGAAVVALLANPIVSDAILGLVDTVAVDFFSAPGVVDAFAAAADGAALDWLGGDSITEALAQASAWLKANAAVEDGVGVAVGGAVTQLLTDKQLWQTVDGAASALVTTLLGDTDVQNALSATIATQVAKSLGGGAVAQTVGAQLGAAVVGLLANPVVSGALLTLVGSVTQTFFSAPGVIPAFSNTADQAAIEVVSGSESVKDALAAAQAALLADPAIQAAIQATVSDAVSLIGNTVLTNTEIQQALGSMVKSLVVGLASSPDVQAYVKAELGPLLSPIVANLLDNPALAEEAATALGAVVTQFMTYPGFSAALTDAFGTFADGVLRGTPTGAAIGEAFAALQSSPPFVAAVNAIVPGDINTLLGYTDVQDAIGNAAQQETVAALHNAGINIGIVDWIAGQFAKGAVESLLNRQPALDLVDAVTVNVLLGMPLADVTPFITQEALSEPMLQIALGLAVGQGIGAIFGENIVGDLIGLATGVPVALGVVLIAGVINVYEWMFGKPNGMAAFAAQATDNHHVQPAAAASADWYWLDAILPDWQQVPDGQFTVTGLATA